MAMTRKTITIPDAMDGWVKAQIESGRYGNDSEYFRDLIRRDQERLESGVSASTISDIMQRVEDRLRKNGNVSTH